MKTFRIFTIAILGLFMVSCGGDDCEVADFLGTYVGQDCEGLETRLVITETAGNAGQLDVELGDDGLFLTFEELAPDGCEILLLEISSGGETASIRLELDGNDIMVINRSSAEDDCDFTLSK